MYTLLIVDDEPLSQVGLKSMLDWRELEVSIVGTASNGAQALEAIARLHPDIVIADIRMPLLDGIGLIERCRAEADGGPEFIVLSGYADFDIARRSLRSAVIDYLVKLELDEATLRASIERAKAVVREKRRSGLSPGGASKRSDPFAETALTRLLTGGFADIEEARSSLERSGIVVGRGGLLAAFFKVSYANEERFSEDERLRSYCCVVDMIKQLLGRESAVLIVPFDTASFAAVLSYPSPPENGAGEAEETLASSDEGQGSSSRASASIERAREMTEKYFGVELRVGIGSARKELLGVADSYREALRAVESTGERNVVAYEDLRGRRESAPRADRNARRAALIDALSELSVEGFRKLAEEASRELGSGEISASEALAICCEFLYPIIERIEDGETIVDSFFPGEAEGWRCIFSGLSPMRAREWLATLTEGLCARFESARSRGRNPLVAGVRTYVQKNYAGKLALSEVAARFRVSPNHLSSIFKKYGGVGFAEYVTQVKVEKAKELLRDGQYKMFEVAQLLGFDDAFYFSKVFKKATGLSPRDYYLRNAQGGSERGLGLDGGREASGSENS